MENWNKRKALDEWDKICALLKNSGKDLSKIPLKSAPEGWRWNGGRKNV